MRTAALRKQHSADAGTDGTFPPSFVSSLPLPTPCISLSPFASFFLRHPRRHRRRWQRAEPTRCVGCAPRAPPAHTESFAAAQVPHALQFCDPFYSASSFITLQNNT